jgi:hypothetical protein
VQEFGLWLSPISAPHIFKYQLAVGFAACEIGIMRARCLMPVLLDSRDARERVIDFLAEAGDV